MSFRFFFSYASEDRNNDRYQTIVKFFEALAEVVRSKSGLPLADCGFIDSGRIDVGANWAKEIDKAIRECAVFVPVLSPTYFSKEYCGREWKLFSDRLRTYAKSKGDESDTPPLILPVYLGQRTEIKVIPDAVKPLFGSLADVERIQGMNRDVFPVDYQREGLQYLYRLQMNVDIERLVTAMAQRINGVAEQYPLPASPDLPSIASVSSMFHKEETGELDSSDEAVGPRFVKFIFVAASRKDIEEQLKANPRLTRRTFDCYGKDNLEWKPYLPKVDKRVGPIVQAIAGDEGFDYESVYPLKSDVMEHVRRAVEDNKIVAIVVDPWTVGAGTYDAFIKELDAHDSVNWVVLIPWNDADWDANDAQKRQQRADMERSVEGVFFNKSSNRNAKRFLDRVGAIDDLNARLRVGLQEAKMLILKKQQLQGEVMRLRRGAARSLPGLSNK